MSDLRCGDLVDVEWESEWYPGVVTDVPTSDEVAVAYTNGDFEDSVPTNVARLRTIAPKPMPGEEKKGKKLDSTVKLRSAANRGDIGLVMEALREGADPNAFDDHGYVALHWAAGPDEGMPGDTIARRACIALLCRVGNKDVADRTTLSLRPAQHSAVRNLVGCVKTFHHVGANLRGTVHWAVRFALHPPELATRASHR
jgi:ankyrin repeat protein